MGRRGSISGTGTKPKARTSSPARLTRDVGEGRQGRQRALDGKTPDQVAFTGSFAYVRSLGTEEVSAVRLSTVGKEPDVIKFPGGQNAPGSAGAYAARADAFVPAPEGGAPMPAGSVPSTISGSPVKSPSRSAPESSP